MGVPALRHDAQPVQRRPHLRVIKPPNGRKPTRSPRTSNAAAHQMFVFFAVCIAVAAALGLGRVWLSVKAAQASIESGKLETAIRSARYQGDMLEIQESALATPSRIQAVAVSTMGMAPATSVSYLRLPDAKPTQKQAAAAPSDAPQASQGAAVLDRVMQAAASEAQMLLVGDVGLASSK